MRILLNADAGSADDEAAQAIRATAAEIGATVVEVDSPDDTREAVRAAAEAGDDTVVAAGGDGTVNLTTTALVRLGGPAASRPALGILPLGTGNDFARTLALPLGDPAEALRVLAAAPARALDVIRLSWSAGGRDEEAYALNLCNGGFAGMLAGQMDDDEKARLGPLAYVVGAARTIPEMSPYRVRVSWDDGPDEVVEAYNVVVANGRTAGGGKSVAPLANPEDGLLDVVIVRAGGTLDLARLALGSLTGDVLADDDVVFNRVARVRLHASPALPFNADGDDAAEASDDTPVTFEAMPGALRVLIGPDYRPDPEPAGPVVA